MSGGIHLRLPCLCSAPLPLPASLHQHAWLLGRQQVHTFWRRCLAGHWCRCWREGVPGQIPVGRRFCGIVTFSVCRFQPSPWSFGSCVCRAAIAVACKWCRDAMPYSVLGCCEIDKQLRPSISTYIHIKKCNESSQSCNSNWLAHRSLF